MGFNSGFKGLNVKQSGDRHHQTATIGSSVQNDDVHDGFTERGDDLDE